MHRRIRPACQFCLHGILIYFILFLSGVVVVCAQYNVTVTASNAVLQYQPSDAWQTVTDQALGDGTARVTRRKGASVSLAFTGTGVYFQTTRAQNRGISTINVDGQSFKVDSSLARTNGQDIGMLWGVLSLKDEKHTISVTQSADDGTELALNAFIYITSKQPPRTSTPGSAAKAIPGPLDADNPQFPRNLSLVFISAAVALMLLTLLTYTIKKRVKLVAVDKASIRLAMSPASPQWQSKSFFSVQTSPLWTDTSSVLKTPSSAAFLIRHSRQDSSQSIDQVLTPGRQIPREHLVHNTTITAETPKRPRFVLPAFRVDTSSARGPSSRATMASMESMSPVIPPKSASSVLEHDGIISLRPGMITDFDYESMSGIPSSRSFDKGI